MSAPRENENQVLSVLKEVGHKLSMQEIIERTGLQHAAVMRALLVLSEKGAIKIYEKQTQLVRLNEEGTSYAQLQDLATSETEIRQVTVVVRPPAGDDPRGQIRTVLAAVDGVKAVADPYEQGGGLAFALETTKDCRAEVSRAVVAARLDLLKLDYARSELENTFIRLVGGADASN